MSVQIEIKNLPKVKRMFERAPELMMDGTRQFLVQAIAAVRRVIWNDPWRMAGKGIAGPPGGSPVALEYGGNLRSSHRTDFLDWSATIGPDITQAPYAGYVHEGTKNMEERPWLPHAEQVATPEVNDLIKAMLTRVA